MKLIRSRSPRGFAGKLVHRVLGVLVVTLLVAPPVRAQEWIGIAGLGVEVKSGKGGNLEQATVTVLYHGVFDEEAIGGPAPRATDNKGRASFSNLALGTWALRVDHPDHLSYVAMVQLSRGGKPQVSSSFLEASGSGRNPIRVKLVKTQGRDLGTALSVASTQIPEPTVPTPKPTVVGPVDAPVETPVGDPVEAQIEAPAEIPIDAPAAEPVQATAEAPSKPPATVPAHAPAEAQMDAPARVAKEAPATPSVEAETKPPIEAPLEVPVQAPPEAPVKPPIETPAKMPAEAPPEPQMEAPAEAPQQSEPEIVRSEPGLSSSPSAPSMEAPAMEAPPMEAPPMEAPPMVEPAEPEPTPDPVELAGLLPTTPEGAVTSYRTRTCLECKPGEWGVSSMVPAAPTSGEGCPTDALDRAETSVEALARRLGTGLRDFAGPVLRDPQDSLLGGLPEEERVNLEGSIGEFMRPGSPCRLLVLVFPARVRISGFRFEALERGRGADCNGAAPCPIGSARWLDNPGIERSAGATFAWALFENGSGTIERQARVTGYFAAPGGWRPATDR